MKRKLFLILTILCMGTVYAPAQLYRYLGTENGLSSRRVISIRKDLRGYMWFLTHEGIDRYNGKQYVHYPLIAEGKPTQQFPNLNDLYIDNSGEIWIPTELCGESFAPVKTMEIKKTETVKVPEPSKPETSKQEASQAANSVPKAPKAEKSYEEMSVEELQEVILEKMRRNGPVTDYMLGTVRENTHHGSLVSWAKSF